MIGEFWDALPVLGRVVVVLFAVALIADAAAIAWLVVTS